MIAKANLDPRDINMAKENKQYISLKEASELSGYSPDYIGQLIRSGKLHGKQVFQNVAWMTTENDLRTYMGKRRGPAVKDLGKKISWRSALGTIGALGKKFDLVRLLSAVLYVLLGLSLCLFLLFFYIFSVSIEHGLEQRAIQKLERRSSV